MTAINKECVAEKYKNCLFQFTRFDVSAEMQRDAGDMIAKITELERKNMELSLQLKRQSEALSPLNDETGSQTEFMHASTPVDLFFDANCLFTSQPVYGLVTVVKVIFNSCANFSLLSRQQQIQ